MSEGNNHEASSTVAPESMHQLSFTTVGQGLDRIDGRLKVTGGAVYSGDRQLHQMAYASLVKSPVTRGKLTELKLSAAAALPGVIHILTADNAQHLTPPDPKASGQLGEPNLLPLQTDEIHYNGQVIAVVIAESFEVAEHAAFLIQATIQGSKPFDLGFNTPGVTIETPDKNPKGQDLQISRGSPESSSESALVRIEQTYATPRQHHNPIEPSATVASWNGEHLTLYDATQATKSHQKTLAGLFGLKPEQVHVICPFVGGAFGCKGSTWAHSILAAMAAKVVSRPVKLVLSRSDMFSSVGYRTPTEQTMLLDAGSSGKLLSLEHHIKVQSSQVGKFIEICQAPSKMLYHSPRYKSKLDLFRLDFNTPTYMRAPGETPGSFAQESALDELAVKLQIDPVQLRLTNYTDINLAENKPFSSKHLKECYERGAQLIQWSKRQNQSKTRREGRYLIGQGMATATYPANHDPASASAELSASGMFTIRSATHEMGQGTYTIMSQIAADALGVDLKQIRFELGDSDFPSAPVAGGSKTAASVGPAVASAAQELKSKLLKLAMADHQSPCFGRSAGDMKVKEGRIYLASGSEPVASYQDILKRAKLDKLSAEAKVDAKNIEGEHEQPGTCTSGTDASCYSYYSFGAQFAEVMVDDQLGEVRVRHMAGVFDAGQILNAKTAHNQLMGGMIMGLGMALMEETVHDPHTGRYVTRNLADYLVATHADTPRIDAEFVNYPDPHFNSLGARGIGEIGITGMAAAIANAVYNATGIRIRSLPITPDKLLGGLA